MKKSEDFLQLEHSFTHIKNKQDVEPKLRYVEKILKRKFDLTFHISIVDNDSGEFFGMCIYPQESILDVITDSLLNKNGTIKTVEKIWSETKEWYIEIDSKLLYDKNLNANPAEIVAVLLHEIGHVVYSNTIPQRIGKVIKYVLLDLDFRTKNLVKLSRISKLLNLSMIEACTVKNYKSQAMKHETEADKFVYKQGYGQELENFITKLIKSTGNRYVDRTEEDIETDVRSVVNWTIENVTELEYRKTKLRNMLQTELLKNPSNYVRNIIKKIKVSIFGDDTDAYKSLATEQYLLQEHRKILMEGITNLFDKTGKVKKINPVDIDIIEIEMSKIENEDDKIYVLDLIHDKINLIDEALHLISENKQDKVPHSKETLLKFKERLEKMAKQVVSMRITRQYGLFIKYPAGYEG